MAKRTIKTQPGTSSAAAISADASEEITGASVCGAGGGSTLTVYHVKSGESADATTMLYKNLSVTDGATTQLGALFNTVLDAGDAIHLAANDAATLTVTITARPAR